MGCDVHMVVEYRNRWTYSPEVAAEYQSFTPEIVPPRWYALFGHLAGVRGDAVPVAEPRGLPADLSQQGKKLAEEWGDYGHSPTWLTADEYERALRGAEGKEGEAEGEYRAILAAMRALDASGMPSRVVIIFDN